MCIFKYILTWFCYQKKLLSKSQYKFSSIKQNFQRPQSEVKVVNFLGVAAITTNAEHFTRSDVTVCGTAKIFTTGGTCAKLACNVSLTFQPCQCINSWRTSVLCFRPGWLRMPFEILAGDQREQTATLFSLLWKEADQEIGH